MKKETALVVIIMLLISIMSYSNVTGGKTGFEVDEDGLEKTSKLFGNSNVQDGRFITKLQWFSPNGELPGTYAEYLSKHPLTHARFTTPEDANNNNVKVKFDNSISILVDEDLYSGITSSLNQYIADLELEGYSTFLQTVSGGTPEEIKSWVKDCYNAGSIGVVFIGDITAAWAEVDGSEFPCDLFYMDLDGKWRDRDRDGDYEVHTSGLGNMGPELYIGRIYANTLTYDTEEKLVNDYLSKTHSYRVGQLGQPWRGLEYVDEDWYDMDVNLNNIYSSDVVRHDYGYYTTGMDYLDQMDLGQHCVQICAHSYSGGHHFGTHPTESASYAHVYIYCPETRSAKLLLGCDDGIKSWFNGDNVYTNDRYGSWNDGYEVDVTLKEGWNRLLCKISQEGGGYRFSARFTDTNYTTFNDLEYRINDPELGGRETEYIRSWLLNGFHQDAYDNFYDYLTTNYLGADEASINPNEGDDMGGKTWTRYNSGSSYIDLSEYCDNADCGVCYAYARVIADKDKSCQLWIGYDDGARVWLNGKEIVYDNRYGYFETDITKLDVTLNSGENRLLVKISEWGGEHGFSATLCCSDGSRVDGFTYDPEPTPITYIGKWLINGPYPNTDLNTRLSTDYLENEETVKPNQSDTAPQGIWERTIGNGCPFNLGRYFDHGEWVFSEDIQNRDPPVLFYNLFACGPGRFTDENYLAGAYIFNTTYGLITVASSKSGSMLNFDDFTDPLSVGSSIGEAFYEWFNAQAPFLQWEKFWYYGMIVCGDPTLQVFRNYPPNKPSVTGATRGKVGETYEYTFVTTEPDGDDLYYCVDWATEYEWFGPYPSGEEVTVKHRWLIPGKFAIKVKAKDIHNAESDWSDPLPVSMPKNKALNPLFLKFLDNHPRMFPILRQLVGLFLRGGTENTSEVSPMNVNKKILGIGILTLLMLATNQSMAEKVNEPEPDQPSLLLEFWLGEVRDVVDSDDEFCFKCVDALYIRWQSMGFGWHVARRVNNAWSVCYDKYSTFWLGTLTNDSICLFAASWSGFPKEKGYDG